VSDDRAQLRARCPVPPDRDLPPARRLVHRENLLAQIINDQPDSSALPHGRRRSRWHAPPWPLSERGLLATAAAVALVAGLGVTAADKLSAHPGTAAAAPAAPGATAATVLDRVAQAAAAGPAVKLKPGDYFYVKGEVRNSNPALNSGLVQGWIPQGQSKPTLWRVGGHSVTLRPQRDSAMFGGPLMGTLFSGPFTAQSGRSLLDPTYAYLQVVPTNPRQLLSLVEQQASGHGKVSGRVLDLQAFELIGALVSTAILPPQTAAALYRAAALIPGVKVIGDATDAVGRHGIAVALAPLPGVPIQDEWIFSTTTYQFLGERGTRPRGTSVSAVLARGVASSLGGTPTLVK
jgi:hypothetical protein